MQFMILQRADARTEGGAPPLPNMLGLQPSADAVRIRLADGQAVVTEGPFADPYATLAGMGVIEAASKEEAIAKAKDWPLPEGVEQVELEVRLGGCPGGCTAIPDAGLPQQGKRFAIVLRSSCALEGEDEVPQSRLEALNAHNVQEVRAGRLISASGLRSTAHGARIKRTRASSAVIDGPFTEIKELIAGYWMVQVPALEDAIAWALKNPYPTGPEVEVEIREVQPGVPAQARPFTADVQVQEARMREAQLESAMRAELAGGR